MKKILKTIILLILIVPFIVKADMGMPLMETYEVEVVKDEINYYDWEGMDNGKPLGTIPKGTTLTIDYGYPQNGIEYLSTKYKNEHVFVKSTDVVAKGEFGIDAEGVQVVGRGNRFKALKEVDVRKGPSESFEKVGTLKAGIYLYKYETLSPNYYYVDTGDIKGWVQPKEGDMLFNGTTYVVPVELDTKCGKIPANYEFKEVWFEKEPAGFLDLEYNNCKIQLNSYNDVVTLTTIKEVYKTTDEITLYTDVDKETKSEDTIPKGKEYLLLSVQYAKKKSNTTSFYYYIEYNKKRYWVESIEQGKKSEYVKEYEEPVEKEEKEEDKTEEKKTDTKTIVIICIVAGTSLALGALVTLILVNKKGKKNEKATE